MESYFNIDIDEWVSTIHYNISSKYDLKTFKITKGDFGYISYACLLRAVLAKVTTKDIFNSIKQTLHMEPFIQLAHDAWCQNYIKYKNEKPHKITNDHSKSVVTYERNDKATTYVENLKESDWQMYQDIITEIFEILVNQVLETGMTNLTMSA